MTRPERDHEQFMGNDRWRGRDDDEGNRIRPDRDGRRFNLDDDDRSGRTWGGREREEGQPEPYDAVHREREPYGRVGDQGDYVPGRARPGRFS